MNRRYQVLIALFIIMVLVGLVAAKSVWSIADPNDPANAGIISDAESQGYWNFQYDDAAPFTTAGLYCCWWERWYKWQKFDKIGNTLNLGSSDDIGASSLGDAGSASSYSGAEVETKSYCPSCCSTCDDEDPAALKARSDAILAKKPWLTEGKTKVEPTPEPEPTIPEPTVAPMVMTFSEEV
jgi:hypothetical protein